MYGDEYIKTEINLYNNRINANFHGSEITEQGVRCVCLSVILLHSVVQIDKNIIRKYLKEYKCAVKKIKNMINEELDLDESDKSNCILIIFWL